MRRPWIYIVAAVAAVLLGVGIWWITRPDEAVSAEAATTTSIAPTSTTSTSTTTTSTTTTTVDLGPVSPIDGLPVDDPELLDRRVLAVKVDNHPNARPQSILDADGMMEVVVEGGLTRFIALFHDSDSDYVGPVRSARPSDAALVRPLEATLAISGGQPWVRAGINALGVEYISDPRPGMFRISSRNAPHNLYGDTVALREVADNRGIPDEPPPTSLWEFGELPDDAEPIESIDLRFSEGILVTWSWDGTRWLRSLNGSESLASLESGETEQIGADTLVVIVGRFYIAEPPPGDGGSAVPATDTVGSGSAFILSEGRVVPASWEREAVEDPFTFTTLDGEPLGVPPGAPWVSIVPDGGSVEWTS